MARQLVIAIVDDDEAVRDATEWLIRSFGYEAVSFASAEEYLHSERVNDTWCLIVDVQMPGMNGVELQERLVADGHKTKIIFMTAFPEERVRARALKAGAMGFLHKPIKDDCLLKYLNKALGELGPRA